MFVLGFSRPVCVYWMIVTDKPPEPRKGPVFVLVLSTSRGRTCANKVSITAVAATSSHDVGFPLAMSKEFFTLSARPCSGGAWKVEVFAVYPQKWILFLPILISKSADG